MTVKILSISATPDPSRNVLLMAEYLLIIHYCFLLCTARTYYPMRLHNSILSLYVCNTINNRKKYHLSLLFKITISVIIDRLMFSFTEPSTK